MAQECGFFNAQLEGEEFDRVYLAEQFAAYFAAFIGNGIYGHSMQKLQVLCQDVPNMSIKVLSGEAYTNGWWYRNTDTYDISVPVADGVLSRIDVVVVRWGNAERDMWLQLITGIPSSNPVKPAIRRDADYFDLQLAVISVPAGAIRITQTQIQDTRLDNAVCGLVTGVVDQIDTTNLYNQFESYFQDFKDHYEADYATWTAQQKQAYLDYVAATKLAYDNWVSNRQNAYTQWTAEKMLEYAQFVSTSEKDYTDYIKAKTDAYEAFVTEKEKDYNEWTAEQKAEYRQWYNVHTTTWTAEFTEWFNTLKDKLSGDVAGNLQMEIDEHEERLSRVEHMVISGIIEAPIATSDNELIATSDGDVIAAQWLMCSCNEEIPYRYLATSDNYVLVTDTGVPIGVYVPQEYLKDLEE